MQITENCHNCKKPRLIDRPWRNDIFCGWCESEYNRTKYGELILTGRKNKHLTTKRREKLRIGA